MCRPLAEGCGGHSGRCPDSKGACTVLEAPTERNLYDSCAIRPLRDIGSEYMTSPVLLVHPTSLILTIQILFEVDSAAVRGRSLVRTGVAIFKLSLKASAVFQLEANGFLHLCSSTTPHPPSNLTSSLMKEHQITRIDAACTTTHVAWHLVIKVITQHRFTESGVRLT